MFTIVDGDLLNATETYICHQTNCLSKGGAAGVARAIFDKWPEADCYKDRESRGHDKPGTIITRPVGPDSLDRIVVNMNAQLYPGTAVHAHKMDNREARMKYFRLCLNQMTKLPFPTSFAFPWRIGCGIAGGDWGDYIEVLKRFESFLVQKHGKANVKLYRLT